MSGGTKGKNDTNGTESQHGMSICLRLDIFLERMRSPPWHLLPLKYDNGAWRSLTKIRLLADFFLCH